MKKSKNFARRLAACLAVALLLCSQAFAMEVPIEQTEQMIDGKQTLTKVFEVDPSVDPATLQEDGLELNGYRYSLVSFTKETFDKEVTQTVSVEQQAALSSNDAAAAKAEAFTALPDTYDYDQDGYAGTLVRDSSTVTIAETGRSKQSGTSTKTKTYEFDYNDESLIPNTISVDGKTYTKRSVSWSEGGYGENSTIPSSYIARVTYSRGWTQSVVDGYTATATYTGDVTLKATTMVRYKAVYNGELIVDDAPSSTVGQALLWSGVGVGAAAISAAGYMLLKKNKAAAVVSTASVLPDAAGGDEQS